MASKVIDLKIDGMTCASCVSHVREALISSPGVISAEVNLANEQARVLTSEDIDIAALLTAVNKSGYDAHLINSELSVSEEIKRTHVQSQRDLLHALIAAAFTLPLLIPMLGSMWGSHWMLPGWLQFALATPVQLFAGGRFYIGSWKALRARRANMDLLVAIGTSAAWGLSTFNWLKSSEQLGVSETALYFESSSLILTFIGFGKWMESRAKTRTGSAVLALLKLRPETARIRKNDKELEVQIADVHVGDLVVVRPGEKMPVDGKVREGTASIDESMLTGESLPIEKFLESSVTAGSINLDGFLVIEAQAIGADTTLAKIVRLVQSSQASRAPIQRLVDRLSAVFVPIVLGIALVTFISWFMISSDVSVALLNAVAVLVIACPCALGLATPTAIMVGTGVAAKYGILFKDFEAIELARKITQVVFDKTGTLTEGHPKVLDIVPLAGDDDKVVLKLAASLQFGSEHPLARSVLEKANQENIRFEPVANFKAFPGKGTSGVSGGKRLVMGSWKFLLEMGIISENIYKTKTYPLPPSIQNIHGLEQSGRTVSWLAELSPFPRCLAVFIFADTVRSSAKSVIERLHKRGIHTAMITGDAKEVAEAICKELEIEKVVAETLPEEKAEIITAMKNAGQFVAMVGDGINDAPALAAAHIGISVATGTDVAIQAAGITLMRSDLNLVVDAIDISRKTYRKIQHGLFLAFIYNILGIPLAAMGLLNPIIAGAAMALSSVSVVTYSLFLLRWKPSIS